MRAWYSPDVYDRHWTIAPAKGAAMITCHDLDRVGSDRATHGDAHERCRLRRTSWRRPSHGGELAAGIADTYPLTVIAELIGRRVPAVVVPFVNSALAGRAPFQRALAALRLEGIKVVSGQEFGWEPHPPGTGAENAARLPLAGGL